MIFGRPTRGSVGRPQSFSGAKRVIRPTAPDKKGVAETVEIADGFFRDAFGASEPNEETFGATADGAADVEIGIEAAAAGQDEGKQRR